MQALFQSATRWPVVKSMAAALIFVAAPVQAMVYMWKDSAGIAHYVNKEHDVPARYKTRVKMMYPDASDSATVPAGSAPAAVQPPAPSSQSARPASPPDVRPAAPAAQITAAPAVPERRARRQRRERDDDE